MKAIGKVEVGKETFLHVMKQDWLDEHDLWIEVIA